MKKIATILFLLILTIPSLNAQDKRAQTSMKFLSISTSARASAMSDAVTSVNMGAYSPFYNPATLALVEDRISVTAGVVQSFADISYNSASIIYKPGNKNIGVFGLNATSADYGDILATVRDNDPNNQDGYLNNGTINPTAMTIGLSYANAITEKFSVGANFKYAYQDLTSAPVNTDDNGGYITESYSAGVVVLDFGAFYKTGFKSLNFAFALRNFSQEVSFAEEEEELPMTFKIGISMNVLDLTDIDPETHSLLVAIDTNRPRDYDEQIFIGTEYTFMKRFVLRGGYGFPKDVEKLSFGFGVIQPLSKLNLSIDYSYTQFGVFGEVNRLSAQIGF
ncbi:MAG: PorV/PorQ family protein [Balneola sp.]|nr:PorV/PorQ family protein [Balneola sp.]MBO6651831.1 PorV/PorQ family protein [Balneola sp.]MBO6710758.1 PorV/PorQ family protein [Balneola sp.]MBO6799445.1 PorV/PorQ family protein [Balneola sp.]MBO6870177.1 PorV/PorQ family protein [Balneola sp.]